MGYVVASLLAIIGVEYVLRIPLLSRTKSLIKVADRSLAVIRLSKASDHWKQIALLRYAGDLLGHTLLLALMLIGLFLLILLPAILIDRLSLLSPSILDTFSSANGLITITIVSTAYVIARRRFL